MLSGLRMCAIAMARPDDRAALLIDEMASGRSGRRLCVLKGIF
jgi:hypothetical protein